MRRGIAGALRPGADLRRVIIAAYLLGPAAILLAVLFFAPLGVLIWESLTGTDRFLGNYGDFWGSVLFQRAARVTFEIALWTTVVCLLAGYAVAYRLTLMRRARAHLLLLVILFPAWTAVLARLYAWTIVLGRRGPINDWLVKSGLIEAPLQLVFNRGAAILGLVHLLLPFMVLILYASLVSIDRNLLDAARSMGAGWFALFRRVLLPLTAPGVVAGSALVFVLSIGNYVTPAILGGAKEYTLPIEVLRLAAVGRFGAAMAVGAVLMLTVLAVLLVIDRVAGIRRMLSGGARR